jgi:hypothetical protein
VPFAGGAEADDDAAFARRQATLVGMRNHRGVEQCGGFDGVLLGEIRTNQSAPIAGNKLAIEVLAYHVVVGLEHRQDVAVACRETCDYLGQKTADLKLGEPENAIQHRLEVRCVRGNE